MITCALHIFDIEATCKLCDVFNVPSMPSISMVDKLQALKLYPSRREKTGKIWVHSILANFNNAIIILSENSLRGVGVDIRRGEKTKRNMGLAVHLLFFVTWVVLVRGEGDGETSTSTTTLSITTTSTASTSTTGP